MWYHLQSLSYDVCLVPSLRASKSAQSCFSALLCYILYFQSLPGVIIILTRFRYIVWPHVRRYIFNSITSVFFAWELAIDTVSIPYSRPIAGWAIILRISSCRIGPLTLDPWHWTPDIGPLTLDPWHLSPDVPSTLCPLVRFCIHISIALQGASQIIEIGGMWQLAILHLNIS